MDYQHILSVSAGILILASYVPYILSILKGMTKPTTSTWLCVLILDSLILASMVAKGTVNGQIVGAWIGVWITLILALKYGARGWSRIDTVCLIIAAIGAACWVVQQDALFGMIGSTVGYCVSYIPTFLSAYHHPSREDGITWFICFISSICALLAVPTWTVMYALQPLSFFFTESVMTYLTCVRPFMGKSSMAQA